MENETIYEAVVAGASGSAGVAGAGGAGGGFDAGLARQIIEERRGELGALSEDELIVLRVDPQRAADIVLAIVKRDRAPDRLVVFEQVASIGIYDLKHLEAMFDYAQVTWHTRRTLAIAAYGASSAALPEAEVTAAYDTRGRMMMVLSYAVGDRPDMQRLLTYLREGSGYLDLANDLYTLAEVYRRDDIRSVLEQDKLHYRATDPADAERHADALRDAQGPADETEVLRLSNLSRRALTLMLRSYNAHQRIGCHFFQSRENVEQTYPSLVTAARSPRRKRKAEGQGSGGEGEGAELERGSGRCHEGNTVLPGRRLQGPCGPRQNLSRGEAIREGQRSLGRACSRKPAAWSGARA